MGKTVQTNLGRLTHSSFGKENPFDVIYNSLIGEKVLSTNYFLYHFKNVQIFESDQKVIYGEIYKSKLSSEHEVLDRRNLTYKPEIIDELFSTNNFVIFTDLSIVFTSSQKFNSDYFIKTFETLYNLNALEAFAHVKIHYRKEDFDIFKKIRMFSRLIEVSLIDIRKSNPTPKPTVKKIEDLLKREQIDILNANFRSETNAGLARDLESLIMSGISIADDGYGDSKITGQNPDGTIEKIKLKDKVIRKRIEKIEAREGFVRLVIEVYSKYISQEEDLTYDK
jgi:hypothetical protein